MGCPPVRGDNPRALASGLSYVQVDKHGITILYHHHHVLFNYVVSEYNQEQSDTRTNTRHSDKATQNTNSITPSIRQLILNFSFYWHVCAFKPCLTETKRTPIS